MLGNEGVAGIEVDDITCCDMSRYEGLLIMNVDYMVFGAGLTGEVRRYEAGSETITTVSKAESHATGTDRVSLQSTLINFKVGTATIEGKSYYFAFIDEIPSDNELLAAILKHRPEPIN